MMLLKKCLSLCLCLINLAIPGAFAQITPTSASTSADVTTGKPLDLSAFGPIKTPQEATETLERAIRLLQAAGGGVILIPSNAPAGWQPANHEQEVLRTPEAPAPATRWAAGPGVTLFDARNNRLILPQVTGMTFERHFSLHPGDSSPHWQYHPLVPIRNNYIKSAGNYAGEVQESVEAGKDRRFYMESTQGIFPGQMLEVGDGQASAKPERVEVKKLGYDPQKRLSYFIADTTAAIPAGTTLSVRTTVSTIKASTRANNELQTFDFYNIREHYSQGDSYQFHGRIFYLGNEYSPREEEKGAEARSGSGSVIYDARVIGETHIFRGNVEEFDPSKNALRYNSARNAHTLATGRPLINLNPRTWITQGHVYVMQTVGTPLGWSRDVCSVDAPWTEEVVGRYIALDEPSEYVPTGETVRRWYQINRFQEENGIKKLTMQRYWWGVKFGSMARLYNPSNYSTSHNNPVLLKYIIAPGTNVFDVAEGVGANEAQSSGGGQRLIRLAPYGESGTDLDFRKGDPVEQAIGAQPFAPIPFRAWLFDQIPGEFSAPVFDILNGGAAPRNAVLSVTGKGGYENVVSYEGVSRNLIRVRGGAQNFMVLRRDKPPLGDGLVTAMEWRKRFQNEPTGPSRLIVARLAMDWNTGAIAFPGSFDLRGSDAREVKGLSERKSPPSNPKDEPAFRGVNVPVSQGAAELHIKFPKPRAGDVYAVKVQPNWLTDHAVTNDSDGFRIQFEAKAPANARINWILIR